MEESLMPLFSLRTVLLNKGDRRTFLEIAKSFVAALYATFPTCGKQSQQPTELPVRISICFLLAHNLFI